MFPLLPVLLMLLWRGGATALLRGEPVSCYIVNLDYVNCSWNQPKAPELNYTFLSGFNVNIEECPEYVLGEGCVSVGCKVPYTESQRFGTFYTSLREPGGSPVNQQHNFNHIEKIIMSPPTNLAMRWKDRVLVLSWEVRSGTKQKSCLQSRVQYGLNDKWQDPVEPSVGSMNFTVSYPSKSSRHKFRVQVRLEMCGSSNWSAWSPLVEWGNRTTDPSNVAPPSGTRVSLYMFGLLAAVFLLLLTCLLVHSERLRVTLIPVVPTPGKNLTELIDTYNGNVEKWLCISKELQEGFKPSFTEHPYTAREYRLVGQSSVESDSGVSLSDSPSISSSSSSSCSSSSSSTSQTSDGSC